MGLTIGITTFSKRFHLVSKLIEQIRNINKTDKIIITVNGEKDGMFEDEYRGNILNLCSRYTHVYPVFFIETRGLSKMWNTLIVHSNTDSVILLNDDISIENSIFFELVNSHVNSNLYNGFTVINNSFSHFIISKKNISNIGYFDERLIGFGEEDGDIVFRCIEKGVKIDKINVPNITNYVSELRHDFVEKGVGKYSKFNRDFIYNKKYSSDFSEKIQGLFDSPMKKNIQDINCYPYESFFEENKNNL